MYMPTTNSSDEVLEEVYENIEKLMENVKRKENLIVMVTGMRSRGRKSKELNR